MATYDNLYFGNNQKKQDPQINIPQNPFWNTNLLNQQQNSPTEGYYPYQQQQELMTIPQMNGNGQFIGAGRQIQGIPQSYDNKRRKSSKYALTPEGQAMVNNQKDLSATQSSVYDKYRNPLYNMDLTGGIGMEQSGYLGGQGLSAALNKNGDTRSQTIGGVQAALAGTNMLLGAGKSVLAGFAADKRNNYQTQRMYEKQRNLFMNGEERPYTPFMEDSGNRFQDGGGFQENPMKRQYDNSMPKNKEEEMLSVISGRTTPESINGNSEIEQGENVNQNGIVTKAEGEKHSEGGTEVELEGGDRVLTDDIRIPSELRSKIAKELGVEVTHKNTFSEVLEKYKTKIGIRKLQKEQEGVFEDLKKYNEKEYKTLRQTDTTKEINEQLISTKINDLQKEIEALQPQVADAFNKIYEAQEYAKTELEDKLRRKDGARVEKEEEFEENGQYEFQNGGTKIKMIYQNGGFNATNEADHNALLNVLRKNNISSDKDITKFFAKCGGVKKYQEGGQQEGQEEVMQGVMQALQQGASPEEVVQMLMEQGAPQDQAVQIVQAVMQQAQPQTQQAPQEELLTMQNGGGIPQQEQGAEQVIMQIAQSMLQGAQPQEIFQQLVQGGVDETSATQILEQASQIAQQMQAQQEEQQAQEQPQQEEEMLTMQYGGMQKFQNGTDGSGFNNKDVFKGYTVKHRREDGKPSTYVKYDENGNEAGWIAMTEDNEIMYQRENTFDENNNEVLVVWKDGDGKITSSLEDTYDENRNLTGRIWKDKDGKIGISNYRFEYDGNNRMIKSITLDKNGKTEEVEETTYDENGDSTIKKYNADGEQENTTTDTRIPSEEESIQMKGNYEFPTEITGIEGAQSNKVTEGSELKDVENIQSFQGEGYGKQIQDINRFLETHKWFFDTEDKINKFRESLKKKGSQPIIKEFQKAYNTKIATDAKENGVSEERVKEIVNKYGFHGDKVQSEDGLIGAFTSSRPLLNFKANPTTEEVVVEEVPVVKEEALIQGYNKPQSNSNQGMGLYDARFRLPPLPLQAPAYAIQDFNKMSPIKVSPEESFRELGRQNIATEKTIAQNLGAQQGANAIASQIAYSEGLNRAVTDANRQNAQYAMQANQTNLQQDNAQQNANVQGLLSYDQKQALATDNNYKSITNYFDTIYDDRYVAKQDAAITTALNNTYQNYNTTGRGDVGFNETNPYGYNTQTNRLAAQFQNNINSGGNRNSSFTPQQEEDLIKLMSQYSQKS